MLYIAGDVSGGRGCRGPRGSERGCWPNVTAPATTTATTTATAANEPLSLHLICRGGQPASVSLPRVAPRPVARSQQCICGRDAAPSPSAGAAQQGYRTATTRTTPSSTPVRPPDLLQHLLSQPVVHGRHGGCMDTELIFGSQFHYKIFVQNLLYVIYFLFIFYSMTFTANSNFGMVSVRTTSHRGNLDSDTELTRWC